MGEIQGGNFTRQDIVPNWDCPARSETRPGILHSRTKPSFCVTDQDLFSNSGRQFQEMVLSKSVRYADHPPTFRKLLRDAVLGHHHLLHPPPPPYQRWVRGSGGWHPQFSKVYFQNCAWIAKKRCFLFRCGFRTHPEVCFRV